MRQRARRLTRRQLTFGFVGAGTALLGGWSLSSAPAVRPVSILGPGSLGNALESTFREGLDVPLTTETHGSARVAQMVASGQKTPDIVAVADVSLFDEPLSPPWFAEFASNELVIAYDRDSEGGRAVADAGSEHWYEPLLSEGVTFGRTDPDLDPLGYRTLFLLELASRYYGVANLAERILAPEQVYPETQLVAQFETGAIDVAVTYRNMAVERGYEYVELPAELDFGRPEYASEWYETVSYALPSGKTVRGGLIGYGATVRNLTDASAHVFDALVSSQYLGAHGFSVPDDYPTYHGDVPTRLAR